MGLPERAPDQMIHRLFAIRVGDSHRFGHLSPRGIRHHKGVPGDLIDVDIAKDVDVAFEGFQPLQGQIENHVGIERIEKTLRVFQSSGDFPAAPILVVAIHGPEQLIVEALHADGQAIDPLIEQGSLDAVGQMVGIGFH